MGKGCVVLVRVCLSVHRKKDRDLCCVLTLTKKKSRKPSSGSLSLRAVFAVLLSGLV